jgi:hypothetical protein
MVSLPSMAFTYKKGLASWGMLGEETPTTS